MQSVGRGRLLVLGAVVLGTVVACGSTTGGKAPSSNAAGGVAAGGGETSRPIGAGTSAGGGLDSGAAGNSTSGSAGVPPEVLTEADPDEPCQADPLAAHWTETAVELKGGANLVFKLGAGGPLRILVGFGEDALLARTSTADATWTEAVPLPGSLGSDYPERVEVSPDGSTALVLWRRAQQMFFNLLDPDGSFAPAVELKAPQDVKPLALSGQRVLFGYGSNQGIQLVEYTPAGGLVSVAPILTNYAGVFRDEGDAVTVFATSGLVAEPDSLYPYTFGKGFAAAQSIPARAMVPSVLQTFFFAFPNGRAARLSRTWQDPATQGMHLTTRQAGDWGTEELVSRFEGELTEQPAIGYAQDRLILAWQDEDKNVAAVREHDGKSWQPEQMLPRSRALQQLEMIGAETSALVLGEQELKSEQVSVKKLYRRGSDGTWYCPKLVPNDFSNLASDGEGFWFGQRVKADVRIWHFQP